MAVEDVWMEVCEEDIDIKKSTKTLVPYKPKHFFVSGRYSAKCPGSARAFLLMGYLLLKRLKIPKFVYLEYILNLYLL